MFPSAYNKHKQIEAEHDTLEKQSRDIDEKIKVASNDVQRLLKLRKRQVWKTVSFCPTMSYQFDSLR